MDHLSPLVGMLSNMQVFIISLLLFIMFRREVKPQPIDTPNPTLHFVCNGFFFQPFWTVYFFFFFNDHKWSNGPLSIYHVVGREWPSGQSAGLWVGRPGFESWMGHYVVALSKSLHSPCFVFSDKNSKVAPRLGGIKQNIFHLLILTFGIKSLHSPCFVFSDKNSKVAPRLGGIKQNIFHLLILTFGIPTNLLCNIMTWWAISTKWTLGVTVCSYDQKCNMIVNDSTRYLL